MCVKCEDKLTEKTVKTIYELAVIYQLRKVITASLLSK